MLETAWENRWSPDQWGYSSVGRAPALQAGGQGFESLYLHVDNEESDPSDEDANTRALAHESESGFRRKRTFEECP